MNFKPQGLITPDCECFRTKQSTMDGYIDKISSLADGVLDSTGLR